MPDAKLTEYLRRNLIHASAVGADANARSALARLQKSKRPPKWLIAALQSIIERTEKVHSEVAAHRDELSPTPAAGGRR